MTGADVLFGRDADLQVAGQFVRSGAGGGALLVTGQPGVGRTALVEVMARRAEAEGLRVVRPDGPLRPAAAVFAGLDSLITPLQADLETLAWRTRRPLLIALGLADGPEPDVLLLGDALLTLFRHAGRDSPLMLVADDVHHLDPASARVLAFAGRRLRGGPATLLATARAGSVLAGAGLPGHRLGPLDDTAASLLLHDRWPQLAVRVRHRLLAIAEGNPLLLVDLAASLSPMQQTGKLALPVVPTLSDRLAGVFAAPIDRLPATTRDLLLLAALEEAGDLAVLRAAAPHAGLLETLAPAERAGLVSVDGRAGRVIFTHPLIRLTMASQASPVEIRRAHRALAAALSHRPERRVRHLSQATTRTDEDVAALLEQSARSSVRRGEIVEAVDALAHAAELSPAPALRVRRLLEAAYLGADVAADLSGATQWLQQADVPGSELVFSLPATVTAANLLVNAQARPDLAHRLLTSGLEVYPNREDADDTVLVDALHSLALSSWVRGLTEAWEPVAAGIARLRPHPPALLDLCARTMGDPVRLAAPVLGVATALADSLHTELNPIVISRVAIGCVYVDRLSLCREALDRVIEDGRAGGAVALAVSSMVSLSCDNWTTGRWDEEDLLAAEGIALCEQYNYPRYSYILQYFRFLIAAVRGDSETALAGVAYMDRWAVDHGAGIAVQFAHHVRSTVHQDRGDFEAAYHEASAISPAGTLIPYRPHALWVLIDLVESAVRTGRLAEARAHVEVMRRHRIEEISSRLALVSAGCAAMVADGAAATAAYERALAVPDAEHWPFDQARIQLAYGEHLRRIRQSTAARSHLREARETFERLAARSWARRAAEELRASGATAPASVAITTTLNAQERRIARLAASGMSNRQIGERLGMSHRTVGAYLYRIFPKLSVTSRAGLRDRLADLPDD